MEPTGGQGPNGTSPVGHSIPPSGTSPVGRSIPDQEQQSQQQSPVARRIRIRHVSPPTIPFRFRSGYRGLLPLEEEEQNTPVQNVVTRSLLHEGSNSLSGNKRGLSLYEHLDLTDPRSQKRQQIRRPADQIVIQQRNPGGMSVEGGVQNTTGDQNSDQPGGEVMGQFQQQLQEKMQEFQNQVIRLCEKQTLELQKRVGELEQDLQKQAHKLMQYRSAYEQSVKCQICFERNRQVVLMPCMHFMYCAECIRQHKQVSGSFCPYCRTSLQGELAVNMMNQIASPSTSQQ